MWVTGKGMQEYECGLGFSTLAEPVPWARVHGLPTGLPMGFLFGKQGATLVLTPVSVLRSYQLYSTKYMSK